MNHKNHLLIVDDDAEIRHLLAKILSEYSFKVSTAQDGQELLAFLKKQSVDLIILDLMMPGEDGLTLCRKIRQTQQTPIIMLTATGAETDKIVGLELGADDYMAKPFNPRELVARIKAVLRRVQNSPSSQTASLSEHTIHSEKLAFSGWQLDLGLRQLMDPEHVEVELSSGEYQLLIAFLKSPQNVLSRDQLLDATSHRPAGPFDRSIDVQVSRLRQKIETNPKKPLLIKTVRGGGYIFTANVTKILS